MLHEKAAEIQYCFRSLSKLPVCISQVLFKNGIRNRHDRQYS